MEQLRTHTRRLNALHPPESHGGRTMVQLYEKGYGKDAAGIAMEAISYGILGRNGSGKRRFGEKIVFDGVFLPAQRGIRVSTWCWWTRRAACRTTRP